MQRQVGHQRLPHLRRQARAPRRAQRVLAHGPPAVAQQQARLGLHQRAHPLLPALFGQGRVGVGEDLGQHPLGAGQGVAQGEGGPQRLPTDSPSLGAQASAQGLELLQVGVGMVERGVVGGGGAPVPPQLHHHRPADLPQGGQVG